MKRIISLALVVLMLFAMAGCTEDNKTDKPGKDNGSQQSGNDSQNDTGNSGAEITEVTEAVVRAYKTAPASDFEYKTGDGIKITEYIGNDSIVVIPSEIDGVPVTEVSTYLFANESAVKGVLIPDTVTSLMGTFANNDDIQVVICEGVEVLEKSVFHNCPALQTIVLGENLRELGEFCIASCPKLEEVYISPNVTNIALRYDDYDVFMACENVTIRGKAGSYIETFAAENNINFVAE